MDINLVLKELTNIRNMCLTSKSIDIVSNQTDLFIMEENGYCILSYEFANYLNEKYSQEFPLDELHALLPGIIEKFGTQIEPMNKVKDLSFYCYKIFLT
ncbi:MAG: hypothetical protein K2K35_06855 [Lachnospiraceae bacterium]|nr:hypothetical protein [Lachnospiraceae bacterium]